MRFAGKSRSLLAIAAALALISADAALLFSPPSQGTATVVRPDAMEHVLAGAGEGGCFGFVLNGLQHPSRYSPWLHWLFLAPFQAAFDDPWAAVFGPWLAATALLILIFFTTRAIAGTAVGILAASLVPLLPGIPFFAVCAMTEIPYCALLVLLLLLWLNMNRRDAETPPGVLSCLFFGTAAALCGAVRATGFVMLALPFFLLLRSGIGWKAKALRTGALVLPVGCVVAASACLNAAAFGSPFRSGYHYWCPVPYEAEGLTFRWEYFGANASRLAASPWTWIAAGMMIVCLAGLFRKNRTRLWTAHVVFALLQSVVLLLLHSFYFFYDPRFYLPIPLLLIGPTLALLSETIFPSAAWKTAVALVLTSAAQCAAVPEIARNHRAMAGISDAPARDFLIAADRVLPKNATFVTPFDPLLTETLVAGSKEKGRRIIPVSRDLEYAGKVAALRPIGKIDPPPSGPTDHCAPALLNDPNCMRPYPEVAFEHGTWRRPKSRDGSSLFYLALPATFAPPRFEPGKEPAAVLTRSGFRLWAYP